MFAIRPALDWFRTHGFWHRILWSGGGRINNFRRILLRLPCAYALMSHQVHERHPLPISACEAQKAWLHLT